MGSAIYTWDCGSIKEVKIKAYINLKESLLSNNNDILLCDISTPFPIPGKSILDSLNLLNQNYGQNYKNSFVQWVYYVNSSKFIKSPN